MECFFRPTSIGNIGLVTSAGSITQLLLPTDPLPEPAEIRETSLITEAFHQLEAYLAGELTCFTLPLAPAGTDFMRAVWAQLCTVPYGSTASYKAIAVALGRPKAMRAVGNANHRNPIPIFIPCHRIIGTDGTLVGYGGGLALKKKLLELEGCQTFTKNTGRNRIPVPS